MGIAGWILTLLVAVVSVAASVVLFQMGIFFFFLPLIFVPFVGMWNRNWIAARCRKCGIRVDSSYCPKCGAKISKRKR